MRKIHIISIIIFFLVIISCTNSNHKSLVVKGEVSEIELEKGEQIYRAKCMNCHRKNGEGLVRVYPPLAKSDFLEKNLEEAIRMVKFGSGEEIKVNGQKYKSYMPASGLNDRDISLVFNYILNSWGNEYGRIDIEIVNKIKEKK